MTASLQEWLYPLGLVSTIAFTLRFLIQWLASEKAHASVVNRPFWWMSLAGNLALGLHSLIQAQFPIFIVQVINAVISCRNLNLMDAPSTHWRRRTVAAALGLSMIVGTFLFSLAGFEDWMRVPTHLFQPKSLAISPFWHLIGTIGVLLFASRFWLQWLQSEWKDTSTLSPAFWWISLAGALFSLAYFAKISDYINLIGPLFGMIPYIRNLMLMRQPRAT